MCYDVSAKWRGEKSENEIRMKEIQKEKPDDYFMDKEWNKLREANRMADFHIRDYDRKIARGVKF